MSNSIELNEFNINGYLTSQKIVYKTNYYICFCTKYNRKLLTDDIALDLESIVKEVAIEKDSYIIDITVNLNHVIIHAEIHPKVSVYEFVYSVKHESAGRLKKKYEELSTRIPNLWTKEFLVSCEDNVPNFIIDGFISSQPKK